MMEKQTPPTIDDLQGEWKIVAFGQNGGKAPFFLPWIVRPRLIVDGEEYVKYLGSRLVEVGTLSVTPAKGGSKFDEYVGSGTDEGETHLGIIRWVGDRIEHIQGKIGGKRPTSFQYSRDSMFGYALMKRK